MRLKQGLGSLSITTVPGSIIGAGVPGLILARGGLLAWYTRGRYFTGRLYALAVSLLPQMP